MQSNQCVVCFPTPCCLNREIEIVSPGDRITCIIQPRPQICGLLLVFCLFYCHHIPCLIYFSFCLYTPKNWATHDSSLCPFQMYSGVWQRCFATVFERGAFRDIQWQTTLNQPWFLYRNAWSQEDYKKPRPAATMEISTLSRALITCLPLTA